MSHLSTENATSPRDLQKHAILRCNTKQRQSQKGTEKLTKVAEICLKIVSAEKAPIKLQNSTNFSISVCSPGTMIRPTSYRSQAANVPAVTRNRVRGFPIELRGARYAIERSGAAKVPGVSSDSVRRFPTGLRGAPLLELIGKYVTNERKHGKKMVEISSFIYTSSEEIIEFPQILTFHDFLMKVQIFHDFQGLKNIKVKFNDFPGFP